MDIIFKDPKHQMLKMGVDVRPATSSFEDIWKKKKVLY